MVALRSLILSVCLVGCLTGAAHACAWDTDTLEQKRSRFPTALELITGKFLRHTREFYEWRIRDRLRRLQADPNNPALADDLAVAYDKTGQDDQAIAVMLDVETKSPGRYETAANLGSFYIHAGRYQDGLKQFDRAIQINPNADFGREMYQKLLVEYSLECRVAGKVPVPLSTARAVNGARGFALFIWRRKHGPLRAPGSSYYENVQDFQAEMDRAVTGILGMMRFGRQDSPLVLEAFGDLLDASYAEEAKRDANGLAPRAYIRASQVATTDAARLAFRELAAYALESQGNSGDLEAKLKNVESQLNQQLVDADVWYEQVRQDERLWIKQGRNVDAAFAQKYYPEPTVAESPVLSEAALAAGNPFLLPPEPPLGFWESLTTTGRPWWGSLILAVCLLALVRHGRRTTRRVEDSRG